MKKLLISLLAILAFSIPAFAQQGPTTQVIPFHENFGPMASGAQQYCTPDLSNRPFSNYTVVYMFTTGTASAATITVSGSTNGRTFSTIDTGTSATGGTVDVAGAYTNICVTATSITGAGATVSGTITGVTPLGSVTVDTTGLATSANQTNGNQVTQICDAGADCVTVTSHKLDVNATVDTTGLATSAIQTDGTQKSQPVNASGTNLASTAGSPTAGTVLAVQGITSGTPIHTIVDSGGGGGSTAQGAAIAGVTGGLSMVSTTTSAPTYTTATVNPINGDTAGNVRVNLMTALPAGTNGIGKLTANSGVDIGDVNAPALELAINSTTSGQTGPLIQCATTTSAPTYTTAKTNPCSTDTAGNLRVAGPADVANTTPPAYANADPVTAFEYALNGQLIVFPYQNPEYFVNGTSTAITDTTSTAVIASAGGSLRNYITHCSISNTDSDTDTLVKILDGSTVIAEQIAVHGGGAELSFPTPLRGTAATAVNAQPVTTGASIIVSCNGFKGL